LGWVGFGMGFNPLADLFGRIDLGNVLATHQVVL
jgi:hypothetical protein